MFKYKWTCTFVHTQKNELCTKKRDDGQREIEAQPYDSMDFAFIDFGFGN